MELITYMLTNILITLPCIHKLAFANKLNDRNFVCQYLSLLILDSWTDRVPDKPEKETNLKTYLAQTQCSPNVVFVLIIFP